MNRVPFDSLEPRRLLSAISGLVFNDRNNNGVYDNTGPDLPLGGVVVYLDANDNAILDAGEASTTSVSLPSGNWGLYRFDGLGVGTYRVRIVVPAGYAQTAPENGARVITFTNPSISAVGANFGARDLSQSSRLSGVAWRDENGNGTRESTNEPILADVRVWVDLNQDGQRDVSEPTTLTDANGRFLIDALNPNYTSTYHVRAEAPAGLSQTTLAQTGGAWIVTINAGNATLADPQFGFRDVTPPEVASARYDVDTSPNRVVLDLTEPSVNTSWTVGFALTVRAGGTGAALPFTMETNAGGVLSYRYASSGATLPDGLYTATLAAGTLRDAAGNTNNTAYTFDFHVLAGDANRDRIVDFDDLLILAQNYGQTGRTFSQGNFDYSSDSRVDFSDLLILAQSYGRSLALPVMAIEPPATKPTTAARKRESVAADVMR